MINFNVKGGEGERERDLINQSDLMCVRERGAGRGDSERIRWGE